MESLTQSYYPLSQLQNRPLPDGVNPTSLEDYLKPQCFQVNPHFRFIFSLNSTFEPSNDLYIIIIVNYLGIIRFGKGRIYQDAIMEKKEIKTRSGTFLKTIKQRDGTS